MAWANNRIEELYTEINTALKKGDSQDAKTLLEKVRTTHGKDVYDKLYTLIAERKGIAQWYTY